MMQILKRAGSEHNEFELLPKKRGTVGDWEKSMLAVCDFHQAGVETDVPNTAGFKHASPSHVNMLQDFAAT